MSSNETTPHYKQGRDLHITPSPYARISSKSSSSTDPKHTSPDGVDFAFNFNPPVFGTDGESAASAEETRRELIHAWGANHHASAPTTTHKNTANEDLRVDVGLLPRLPSVKSVLEARDVYEGPTEESNWVILNNLMVGAYPSSNDDELNDVILSDILSCGVTTFVCLQQEYDHTATEEAWRSGARLRPYIYDAMKLSARPSDLEFLHVPIQDCGTTNDGVVLDLATDLCWRLIHGQVIYLHCWGGHGRSGTVAAVMLGLLYGVDKNEALDRTQMYHDLRTCPLNVRSPQTPAQREQVERILDSLPYKRTPLVASPRVVAPSPRFTRPTSPSQDVEMDASFTMNNWNGIVDSP